MVLDTPIPNPDPRPGAHPNPYQDPNRKISFILSMNNLPTPSKHFSLKKLKLVNPNFVKLNCVSGI